MAERVARASLIRRDGRAWDLHGPGRPVGGMAGSTETRLRDAPRVSRGARDCRALRVPRGGGRLDGHRARPPALGDFRHSEDRRRRDAHAGSDRAVCRDHAALLRACGRRGRRTLPPDHPEPGGVVFSLPNVLAGIILVSLTAYVLFGGADFGGGVWYLLASGPRRAQQREVIAKAIAPVWEANHVWLILAIVLLFTCFSRAFAVIAIGLHIPLTLMLIGIVLRGSAFVFQTYGGGGGRVFATASLVTPVLLGMCVGAVASGTVWFGVRNGTFVTSFIRSWFTPFGFAVGIFTLACFAFLAAVYLTLETKDTELQEDFRLRAIAASAAVFAMAVLGLAVFPQAPPVNEGVVALTAAAALAAFWSLWRRRYKRARIAAAAQVTLIVWGWGIAQYPSLLPPDLTIAGAAAPRVTLELALIAVVAGAIVLFPSLYN